MKLYLNQQLINYLIKKKSPQAEEEILKDVVEGYRERLENGVYVKHTKAQKSRKRKMEAEGGMKKKTQLEKE